MQLLERQGGLGRMQLSDREEVLIQHLFTHSQRADEVQLQSIYYEPDSASERNFLQMMGELFPTIIPAKNGNDKYTVVSLRGGYKEWGAYEERHIEVKLNPTPLPLMHLRLMYSPTLFCTTLATSLSYETSVIDDLVHTLGWQHNPPIRGIELIKTQQPEHGFADITSLPHVEQLYTQAATLLDAVEGKMGIALKDLRTLREDSTEHPNLVVREMSHARYHQLLQELVLPKFGEKRR